MVKLCLDPRKLNQALIRLVHRELSLNDTLPKVTNVCYMTIINVNSWYNLKINLKINRSYLTTFACQIGRYTFTRLPLVLGPAGDMFQ